MTAAAILAILGKLWAPILAGLAGLAAVFFRSRSAKATAERDAAEADYDTLHRINEATREKLDPASARVALRKRLPRKK